MKIASLLVASTCGGKWAWSHVTSQQEPVSADFHFEGEQWKVSDMEIDREAVESCHFQPKVYSAMSEHKQRMATVEAKNTPQ